MNPWAKNTSHESVRRGLKPIFPRLWRYSLALTGDRDRANDLAQAACLRALEKAELFEVGTKLDRWLFRLTQRLWYNELRSQAVRIGGGLSSLEDANLVDPAMTPEANTLGRDVMLGVMRLPEAQRAAVLLVYAEGHSYREAAEVLEVPVGTIMSRLAVARSRLSKEFEESASA